MQVWPAFDSLPNTRLLTVLAVSAPGATTAGLCRPARASRAPDFTGRLHDLAADRRAAGEHQVIERQCAEPGPDVRPAGHHRDLIGGNSAANIVSMSWLVRGVSSEGFSITRLPAARAVASGMKVNEKG